MATAAVTETMKGSDRNVTEEHQGYIEYRNFCEQWVDKMDFVVSDAPCTFEADPSRSAFRVAISQEKAVETVGPKLTKQNIVSLIFLLLDDPAQALDYCLRVEQGRFPEPAGKIFMASLIYNGIKKNLPRWDVKIVCALHLLRKYQAVYDLVDMTREEVRKKFEQLEYLYLDTRRVGLFKIADNLVDTDSQSLCRGVMSELGVMGKTHHQMVESNMLSLLCEEKLSPGELEAKILEKLPNPDLRTFLKKPIERPSSTACATARESDGVTRLENGYCVVLNQEKYDSESDVAFAYCAKSYRPRTGTQHDVCALKRVFKDKFGCEFEVYNDLSSSQIIDTFRRLANQDFSNYGYLVVAILSHGERASNEDVIIGTDGRQVSLDDITKPFTNGNVCKTLIDKLKLFIVQACRGEEINRRSEIEGDDGSELSGDPIAAAYGLSSFTAKPRQKYQALEKDFIVFYSTIPGYVSFRNVGEGSYFIQILARELEQHGTADTVLDLFTRTIRVVSEVKGDMIPIFRSAYTKRAVFVESENNAGQGGDAK